jgi:hypothetical protein
MLPSMAGVSCTLCRQAAALALFGAGLVALLAPAAPARGDELGVMKGIVIYNLQETTIRYVLNDTESVSLAFNAGGLHDIQSAVISFDRGTGEVARYSLQAGTYEFYSTGWGWELRRNRMKATIDNSKNATDFGYVVLNQTFTVPAGQTQTLECDYLLAIRFDNGQGKVMERRLRTGTYDVLVMSDGTLDVLGDGNLRP